MTRLRSSKPLTLAVVALLSGAMLLAWSMTWYTVGLAPRESLSSALEVGGDAAAPALVPLALASLALVAALAIAGPTTRVVLALVLVGLGAGVSAAAAIALIDPLGAVESSVVALTGLDGTRAVESAVTSVAATAWPAVTVALGAMLVVTALGIAFSTRSWAGPSARYDSPAASPGDESRRTSSVSDWDSLSEGDDPTGDSHAR